MFSSCPSNLEGLKYCNREPCHNLPFLLISGDIIMSVYHCLFLKLVNMLVSYKRCSGSNLFFTVNKDYFKATIRCFMYFAYYLITSICQLSILYTWIKSMHRKFLSFIHFSVYSFLLSPTKKVTIPFTFFCLLYYCPMQSFGHKSLLLFFKKTFIMICLQLFLQVVNTCCDKWFFF